MDLKSFAIFEQKCDEIHEQEGLEALIQFLKSNKNQFEGYLADLIDFDIALYLMRLGNIDKTLEELNKYLDEKKWFNPKFFKEIWDKEEMKPYIKRWEEVKEQDQLNSKPKLHVSLPNNYDKGKKYPLFIALHNSNGHVDFFKEYWNSKKLMEDYIVLMPQSSQLFSSFSYCWDDSAKAHEDIKAMYEEVISNFSIDTENVVIGGFSQGAELAIDIAVNQSFLPVKGFIALNISKMDLKVDHLQNAHTKGVKGVIISGEKDKFFKEQSEIIDLLNEAGINNKFIVEKDLGHWFPKDFSEKVDSSLNFILSR